MRYQSRVYSAEGKMPNEIVGRCQLQVLTTL